MKIQPNKLKFKKIHLRGIKIKLRKIKRSNRTPGIIKNKGITRCSTAPQLHFGQYGLISLKEWFPTAELLKTIQMIIKRISPNRKKRLELSLNVFPHIPVTAKATGARMGGGQGKLKGFIGHLKANKVLLELVGQNIEKGREKSQNRIIRSLSKLQYKLPVGTQIVSKKEYPLQKHLD